MKYPRPRTVGCLLFLASCLTGCKDTAQPGDILKDNARTGFIAFVGPGPSDPVWPVLENSAKRYVASDSGLNVRFFNAATDTPQAQIDLLKSLRDPEMRGLCIQVNEPGAVVPVLHQMQVRGVAVVSMVEPAPEKARFAHVGLDETAVGRKIAKCTIEGLGPAGGTIMLLHAGFDHPFYGARYLAYTEAMKSASQITTLGEFDCLADPRQARQIIKEKSERFPRLTAWVSLCDWPLQDGYPAHEVFAKGMRYFTFGGFPRHWPLIRNGRCPCVVGAQYDQVGGKALQFCFSAIRDPAQAQKLAYVPLRHLTLVTVDEYEKNWATWLQPPPPQP